MKNLSQLGGLLLTILCALIALSATGNLVVAALTVPLVSYAFQILTGVSFSAGNMAYCTLLGIPKTECGITNPGGLRKVFILAADQITGQYPKRSHVTGGELTTAPTFAVAATFVEAAISDNSAKFDMALKGSVGYQSWEQSLELKIAGFTKEQCAAIDKLINTEVVVVGLYPDGLRSWAGSSINGLQFEITHTSGAKGSDRREWTLKVKQDGFEIGITPIASSVVLPGVTA